MNVAIHNRFIQLVYPAVRTCLAAILCLAITRYFRLPEGYWAVISTIVVLQSNVGGTVSASWNRLAGTAIGAAVGAVFVSWAGYQMWSFGLALLLTFLACSTLRLAESYRLAGITVGMIMLVPRAGSPWVLATHRFLEIAVGICVAVVVSTLVWPSHARSRLRRTLESGLRDVGLFYTAVMDRYRGKEGQDPSRIALRIRTALNTSEVLLKEVSFEPGRGSGTRELLTVFTNHLTTLFESAEALERATRNSSGNNYFRKFSEDLDSLGVLVADAFERLADSLRRHDFSAGVPALSEHVSTTEAKIVEARKAGVTAAFPFDEALSFYSVILDHRVIAQELERAQCSGAKLTS